MAFQPCKKRGCLVNKAQKMKHRFLGLLMLCLVFACSEDDPVPPVDITANYLVFGQFASGMNQEDSQLFRVDRSTFEKDVVNDVFPRLNYEFEAEITMSEAEKNNAQQLIDLLPDDLLQSTVDTFGCPDCHDQGGYFLEFGDGQQRKKILLDIVDTQDQTEDIIAYKNAMATLLLLWVD